MKPLLMIITNKIPANGWMTDSLNPNCKETANVMLAMTIKITITINLTEYRSKAAGGFGELLTAPDFRPDLTMKLPKSKSVTKDMPTNRNIIKTVIVMVKKLPEIYQQIRGMSSNPIK